MPHVYILRCADGVYYTGSTRNLEHRLRQHSEGLLGFTKNRRPLELVYECWFDNIADAYAMEQQIHGWSRKKKEALIEGDFDALRRHAKSRTTYT